MQVPPAAIQDALLAAARKYSVPYTLLAAIAWQESRFDPSQVGPTTPAGWRAQGLMQLSPAVIERYKVADPFSAAQSANAAAQLIARVGKATQYDWRKVAAAYVWGPGELARAELARTTWPASVSKYASDVLASRRWLQDRAEAGGSTSAERLNNAWVRLAHLNPGVPAIATANGRWQDWWNGERRALADNVVLTHPTLRASWLEYARMYDLAPNTDATTPPPWKVEPKFWQEVAARVESTAADVATTAEAAAHAAGYALEAGGWALVALLALWYFGGRPNGKPAQ